jgi:hypothetical protein
MLARYLLALWLTLIIEGSIAYLVGLRGRDYILAVAMINVITNLSLNYLILVLDHLGLDATFMLVVLLEIGVVMVEWQLLVYVFRRPKGQFLIASSLANAASFLIGWLLFWT